MSGVQVLLGTAAGPKLGEKESQAIPISLFSTTASKKHVARVWSLLPGISDRMRGPNLKFPFSLQGSFRLDIRGKFFIEGVIRH